MEQSARTLQGLGEERNALVSQRRQQAVAFRGRAHAGALGIGQAGIFRRRFGLHQIAGFIAVRAAVHQHVGQLMRESNVQIARTHRDPDRIGEFRPLPAVGAAYRLGIERGAVQRVRDKINRRPWHGREPRQFARNRRQIIAKAVRGIEHLEFGCDDTYAALSEQRRHVFGRGKDGFGLPRRTVEDDQRKTQPVGCRRFTGPREIGCGKEPAPHRLDRGCFAFRTRRDRDQQAGQDQQSQQRFAHRPCSLV